MVAWATVREFHRLTVWQERGQGARAPGIGDRLDNDVLPAAKAGMRTALIRRGPWGWIHQHDPAAEQATVRIDSLTELPELIAEFNAAAN
ncbi:HAD hydrolase-like protein [Streptomyces sp. 1331.2]|uniref:HAD hydrolase-like protein n=1 Tax=Streptomyces sp. 1331.2 TaxID=1938835 RepID=UPI000BC72B5D|nr:HAD hydrolase-like protein [Streptomyces sp. 1331.2]SOB88430.1 HAD-hyrolase-like [Streptomyces sp. 1331.2]